MKNLFLFSLNITERQIWSRLFLRLRPKRADSAPQHWLQIRICIILPDPDIKKYCPFHEGTGNFAMRILLVNLLRGVPV